MSFTKRVAWLMLGACALIAVASGMHGCRSAAETDSSNMPGTSAFPSQVKPAVAPTSAEPEPLAVPGQEPVELPRGVSAPQPDARELAVEQAPEPSHTRESASAAVPNAPGKTKQEVAIERVATPPVAAPSAPHKPARTPPIASPSKPPAPKAAPPPPVPPAVVQPAAPPPPPPPAAKVSVIVPHTDHVHVEVPSGLQHWLDEDDRMRPWLSKAVSVADSCYAKVREDDPAAAGAIAFALTMHENARPSGSVRSVSGPINSIVMCATTRLLGVKMPLFTGREGESYSVQVRFDP